MSLHDDERDESPTVLRHYPGEQILRRFTLERELAGGGMGVVWLARDEELNRRIALKFLPDRVRNDLAAIQHLKSEAIKSIELAHPHIVRIYDFLYDRQNAAISMEFVDGETLSSLRKARPSRVFEAYDLRTRIRQLCSALEYAHEVAEIVHRDLKPANLMVNRRDQLKVTDFGIASSLQLTKGKQESAGGTPGYMSPQQAARHAPSVLDDVYSLGATIYDLLTSRTPFYDEERKQNVAHLPDSKLMSMQDRRHQLRIGGEPVPRQWEEAVAKCLDYQPSNRPQSIREVADLLGLLETTTRPSFQAPEAPTGLKPRNGDRRVSLSWNPSPGALTYQIKRAAQPGGPYNVIGTVNDATEFSDTTAENGTVYFYAVEAANNVSASPLSGEVKGEPQAPPAPPVNLRSRVRDRTVQLEWDAASGATRYIIKRAARADEPFTIIATVTTGTRFQDGGVENDVAYRYIVEAVNSVGAATPSVEYPVTPCPLPQAPQELVISAGNRSLILKWRAVSGAAAYRVLRSETPGGPYYELKTLDSAEEKTAYEDKQVQNGSTYYYVVEALNAAGPSPHSIEVRGEPQSPPAVPMNLRTRVADRTVHLEWDAATGAVCYHIKRADKPTGAFKVIATVSTGTRFQDGGVENELVYRYIVDAVGSSGLTSSSGEIRATPCPLPIAPLGITISAGDEYVRLAWRKVQEAVAYRILRSEIAGGPYQLVATLEEKTTYDDSSVRNQQSYHYVIESLNAAGVSPQSHEVSAMPMPVPQVPMGLRAESQDGQALISWAASSYAGGYNIQRASTPGGPYTPVATVTTGTSYLDPNLENGSIYYYVLLAFNNAGYSGASQEISVCPTPEVVEPVEPPRAPLRIPWAAIAAVLLLAALAGGGWYLYSKRPGGNQGLDIASEPRGAKVIINGEFVGTTPLKRTLVPTNHVVRLELDGYETYEQPVTVNSNTVHKLSALLNRSKGMLVLTPKQPGRYDYTIKNEKDVIVKAGTTEVNGSTSIELETGKHVVAIVNPGWPDQTSTVEITRKATTTLVPDFEPAIVTLKSDPERAQIVMDGKTLGTTPLNIPLPPGPIKLQARYLNLADVEESIVVKRGGPNEHTFRFGYGFLVIQSSPSGASVYSKTSGELLGQTPFASKTPLAAGSLEIDLQLAGYDRKNLPIKIPQGQTVTQIVTLSKFTEPKGTLFVDAVPTGSAVLLNGERWGQTGMRIEGITPGSYRLQVQHEGYEPSETLTVTITTNQNLVPKITLLRSRGTLQLASIGSAVRYLIREPEGKVIAQGTGPTNLNLPVGSYQLETARNFWEQVREEKKEIAIARNGTLKFESSLQSGRVQLKTDPAGTEILWENQVRTTTPETLLELPIGTHVLTGRHPLLGTNFVEVKVEANKSATAEFKFEYGSAEITSQPAGADVMIAEGRATERSLGVTPLKLNVLKPGPVNYVLRKNGYRPKTIGGLIESKSSKPLALTDTLEPMAGSLLVTTVPAGARVTVGELRKAAGEKIENLGVGTHKVEVTLPDYEAWQTNVVIQDNKQASLQIQLTRSTGGLQIDSQPPGAKYVLTFAGEPPQRWEGITPQVRSGLPVGTYSVALEKGIWRVPSTPLTIERRKTNAFRPALPFGHVSLATEPPVPASLEINGTDLGTMQPGRMEVAMGTVSVQLKARGYKPFLTNFNLGAQQEKTVTARLERAFGPQPGERWTNSLGLIFVPLGNHHLCITETRRMDFEVYEKEAGSRGGDTWKSPQFNQTPADPVVNINLDDAKAFIDWLNRREHRLTDRFRLEEQTYRLPTETEWSDAITPKDSLFIWGGEWPPPSNAGNFDELLTFDGFGFTSPVAYFKANRLGFYDLAGNVWEWCETPGKEPVLRGGSWIESSAVILNTNYRLKIPSKDKRRDAGFRLLIDSGKGSALQAAR